jgi:hypothetical protein
LFSELKRIEIIISVCYVNYLIITVYHAFKSEDYSAVTSVAFAEAVTEKGVVRGNFNRLGCKYIIITNIN